MQELRFDAALRVVRDIFLFRCYTGLAYADVKKLKQSEIIIGVDGEQWQVSRRQKTDISARIPLLPADLTIIERYKAKGLFHVAV